MKKIKELMPEAYDFNGKLSLKQAIPLGLQHVMAMFVGNLTPLLIITGACGIGAGSEYASIQVALLQNARNKTAAFAANELTDDEEKEILYARNSRFFVIEKFKEKGIYNIILTEME